MHRLSCEEPLDLGGNYPLPEDLESRVELDPNGLLLLNPICLLSRR